MNTIERPLPAAAGKPRLHQTLTLMLASLIGGPALADDAALLQRLEQLEQRLTQLEQQNQQLQEQLKFRSERLERVEQRAAKAALPGVVPTTASVNGDFSFKLRGVLNADAVAFAADEGGYDYNSGSALRRARIGLEGDAWSVFKWRLEADFSGNQVGLTDAYLAYVGLRPWTLTFGQHKAPFGLESNNSDNNNVFLERGIFTNALGTPGAERRIGLSALYGTDQLTAGFGLFGDNESSARAATASDEGIGANARVTWAPIFEPGHILQLGASGYLREQLKEASTADAVRFADRPGVRVDGGVLADSGVIPQVDSLAYLGAEAVYVHGPLTLASEAGRARANRRDGLGDIDVDGYYAYASWFLSGESRSLKTGNYDRLKPFRDFDRQRGGWGAFELALRYDRFDFSETPVAALAGNRGHVLTTGLNWYLNPNLKLMLNWLHIHGANTPLDPVGERSRADALAARLHLDW